MIKSFSKINLTLRVMKKRSSGLHEVESNVVLINLFDKIRIYKIKGHKDKIIFCGQFKNFVKKKNNSIKKTLLILRKEKKINNYYKIIVEKKIPVFAGLGGGTSNAVFLLKYLIKSKITNNLLKKFEKNIGSDFMLFFRPQCFQKKINKIFSYKKKHTLYFLLIYPKIKCSTKLIYSKVIKYNLPSKLKYQSISSKGKFLKLIKKDSNDLQSIVQNKFPKVESLLNFISQLQGCELSRMTGSGSVCYGVFNQKKLARLALSKTKRKYPKFWCAISKTI